MVAASRGCQPSAIVSGSWFVRNCCQVEIFAPRSRLQNLSRQKPSHEVDFLFHHKLKYPEVEPFAATLVCGGAQSAKLPRKEKLSFTKG